MENFLPGDEFYFEEELNTLHQSIKENSFYHFQSIPNPGIDIKSYLSEIEVLIDEEFEKIKQNNKLRRDLKENNLENMTNEFLAKYEEKMEQILELVDGQSELLDNHEQVKDHIVREFKELNPFTDSSLLDPY